MGNINLILKNVLEKIEPSKEELSSIKKFAKNFTDSLREEIKKKKINAEVFVGGSFAKGTMVKKGLYDIDVFMRFGEGYRGKDISKLAEKIIRCVVKKEKISIIHGSRDYFKIEPEDSDFFIEIIPVMKVKKPKDAENITDLSYFHVNYIKKRLKTEKMLDEVRLAKAFCHANKCYGAESYISGFSGYAIELLIYYYKNFLNFIRAMTKIKDKEIIDIERLYRNRHDVEINMNSAKMISPIILIDPTYRERNALAALSKETFEQFREICKKFLKNPSKKFFETEKIDIEKIKRNAIKNKKEFILLKTETDKQEGDVAGSKLIKFYRHLKEEIDKYYIIYRDGFDYSEQKDAQFFFVVKDRKEIILRGPDTNDKKENIKRFRQRHKNIFEKKGKLYAKEKTEKNIKEFIKEWMNKNSDKMNDMHITELRIED